jgi:hypothetical protein
MVDYAYDDGFDIYTTDRGDWATVAGYDEFEQDVITALMDLMQELPGSVASDSALHSKVNLAVSRVAGDFEEIQSVESVRTNVRADNVLEVAVKYNSGEVFTEEI